MKQKNSRPANEIVDERKYNTLEATETQHIRAYADFALQFQLLKSEG